MVLVLAKEAEGNRNEEVLANRFAGLGSLPSDLPQLKGGLLRGISTLSGERLSIANDYLVKVEKRIPAEYDFVYGFFFDVR